MVRSAARFLLVLLIRFSIRNSAQRAGYLFNTNISKYLTKVFVIHDLELYRFSIFLNFEVVLVTLTPTMTEDEAVSKKKVILGQMSNQIGTYTISFLAGMIACQLYEYLYIC